MKFMKKNKEVKIKDPLSVKMLFSEDFKPENNEQVKKIIEDVTEIQAAQGVPPLAQTLPFATFKTASDLFEKLRDELASQQARPVEFDSMEIWEFDDSQKQSNSNPSFLISIPDFKISYDFQNVTKPVFEEVFNDVENADISFDDKEQLCQRIKQIYIDSNNANENEIARIPEPDEVIKGEVTLDVPAFSYADDEKIKDDPNAVYYDKDNKVFSESDPSGETESTDSSASHEPLESTQTDPNIQMQLDDVNEKRSQAQQLQVDHNMEQKVIESKQRGAVEAGKFNIEPTKPVDVGEKGYVDYALNEYKQHLNEVLELSSKKISEHNSQVILKNQENYNQLTKKAVIEFQKEHNTLSGLHDEIESVLMQQKNQEQAEQTEQVEITRRSDLAETKRVFETQVEQINQNADKNIKSMENDLVDKYNALATQEYNDEVRMRTKALNEQSTEVRKENMRKFELQLTENVAELTSKGNEALRQVMEGCLEDLRSYRVKLETQQLNAEQIKAAKDRAEAEKIRQTAPFEEVKQLTERYTNLREFVSKVQAERSALQTENGNLKSDLSHEKQRNDDLSTQKVHEAQLAVVSGNEKKESSFDKYLKVITAKEMTKNSETTNKTPDSSAAVLKGAKRLLVIGGVLITTVAGTLGWYSHTQNTENEAQISRITKQLNTKNIKSSKPAVKTTIKSQEDIDGIETKALHSDSLSGINKEKNATFYELDKAIISDDSDAVVKSVQNLQSYDLKDKYRATQTESLLKEAGWVGLSTQVTDAN